MRAPVLWLPPAQNLEGIDLVACSVAVAPLLEAPSGVLAILEAWSERSPDVAVVEGPDRHIKYDGYLGVLRLADADPQGALGEATVVAYQRSMEDILRGYSVGPTLGRSHLHPEHA